MCVCVCVYACVCVCSCVCAFLSRPLDLFTPPPPFSLKRCETCASGQSDPWSNLASRNCWMNSALPSLQRLWTTTQTSENPSMWYVLLAHSYVHATAACHNPKTKTKTMTETKTKTKTKTKDKELLGSHPVLALIARCSVDCRPVASAFQGPLFVLAQNHSAAALWGGG